jgi:uridine kinase
MSEEFPFQHIRKRDGAVVPFTPLRITNAIYRAAVAVGGRDRTQAETLTRKVVDHVANTLRPELPTVEMFQDAIEKILIESGHAKTAKAFILYRDERTRKRETRERETVGPRQGETIPWKKIWEVLNWAIDHRVATVGQLNERIAEGSFPDLIRESEEAYALDIARAADAILKRKDEVRLVIVAGPSSSGKTTTTIKIAEHLKNEGFEFVPYHVDNYFFDLEVHPKDEFGDYDYETPQAIDLQLLNEDLRKLYAGEEVAPPIFNFVSGKREGHEPPMRLKEGQILLIDTLHGLYGAMTEGIPAQAKFKLYIETLLQMRGADGTYIRWTDLRLLRRITRDSRTRNMPPRKTLEHWHYVRSSELRHICPYVTTVDYVVNGALPYELPVWAAQLRASFAEWSKDYANNSARADCHRRGNRVSNLLESITPWTDETVIPEKALLREFIGGSSYKY